MKALIIEDETVAAQALENLITEADPDIRIAAVLQSVSESVEWLSEHGMPELIFMDIHLADGSSFAIFDRIEITCPVIFTTAYDEYAIKAFKVNSVDYLLKPIDKNDLKRALDKLKLLRGPVTSPEIINSLIENLRSKPAVYRSSLLVSLRDKLIPVPVKEIAYFYIDNKTVRAYTFDKQSYALGDTMEELAKQLDPRNFFRANRQFIIKRSAVKDISAWFGSKLAVNMTVPVPEKIIVSRSNSRAFKEWITETE